MSIFYGTRGPESRMNGDEENGPIFRYRKDYCAGSLSRQTRSCDALHHRTQQRVCDEHGKLLHLV